VYLVCCSVLMLLLTIAKEAVVKKSAREAVVRAKLEAYSHDVAIFHCTVL
jgi:hypothetical protein